MNEQLYTQYQQQVVANSQIVYYDQILMNGEYRNAIKKEPMIGIKVLLRDMNATSAPSPRDRIQFINTDLFRVLNQTGCFLRESKSTVMNDGFWLVSFPVPRSQLSLQINQIINTMNNFGTFLGFTFTGLIELYISGRATQYELMSRISMINMPEKYQRQLVKPDSGSQFISYNLGCIIPINQFFSLIKTRWSIDPVSLQHDGLRDTIENVSLRLSSVFY